MLEKPNLADETILTAVREAFGFAVDTLEFLPLGYDSNAGVYKATGADAQTCFVKVKRGGVYQPSLLVPQALKASGITNVVAPLPTRTGDYSTLAADFALIAYPFIDGDSAMTSGLTDAQWIEYGRIVRALHHVELPPELRDQLPHETFIPEPRRNAIMHNLLERGEINVEKGDRYGHELAAFWNEHRDTLVKLVAQTEALSRALQKRSLPFVFCHADVHTNNVLVDRKGNLFIVDWDQPIYAPKERDLMFIIQSVIPLPITPEQEARFFEGYGHIVVDQMALAFYRCDWAMQDLGDFADQVFNRDFGDESKAEALKLFKGTVNAGGLVELGLSSAESVFHKG